MKLRRSVTDFSHYIPIWIYDSKNKEENGGWEGVKEKKAKSFARTRINISIIFLSVDVRTHRIFRIILNYPSQ